MIFWWLGFVPFGGALAVRLHYEKQNRPQQLDLRMWAIYGGCALVALALWGIALGSFEGALGRVLAASVVGFLGPELWRSCRSFVAHPKVFGVILTLSLIIVVLGNQQLWGILLLGWLVYAGFRRMIRPLSKGKSH
jgi:hypothetical protein